MEKINWKNGQTPLNETNLNQMQDNIEKSCVAVSKTQPTTLENVWIKKGNNLYDEETMLEMTGKYRAYNSGKVTTSETNKGLKLPVEPNTTYTITQANASDYHEVCFYDENFNYLSGTAKTSTQINTPSNCYYMTIQTNINATDIMINKGSTALPYEAYIEKEIYIKNDNGVFERFYKEENIESGTITYSNNFSGSGWRPNIVEKCGKMVSLHLCIVSPTSFADNNRQLLAASIPTKFAPKTTRIGQVILDGSSGFGQYFIYQDGNIVVNFEKAGQQVLSLDISYFTN